MKGGAKGMVSSPNPRLSMVAAAAAKENAASHISFTRAKAKGLEMYQAQQTQEPNKSKEDSL